VNTNNKNLIEIPKYSQFPLSSKYDPQWILDNQMGPNALILTEWLCQEMELEPGMKVLDMGCGKVMSSIFLARELGVQVWANDLWISSTDNWQRIKEAGLEANIYPIYAEARSLPYSEDFFDAIVCLDSYIYYGADDLYLNYFRKFVRSGGQIGIVVPGLAKDFNGPVPEHLTRPQKSGGIFWSEGCWSFHTVDWWQHFWERTGLVDVEVADFMPDGWRVWQEFAQFVSDSGNTFFLDEAEALEVDKGECLALIRMIARRKR